MLIRKNNIAINFDAILYSSCIYACGGEVLKLLRIKPLRKKAMKAGSCVIVNTIATQR
jgi:hypothetical protein